LKTVEGIANTNNVSSSIVTDVGNHSTWVDGHDQFVMNRSVLFNDHQVIITDYNGVFALDGIECTDYLHMHSVFLTSLIPVPVVAELVNTLFAEYFEDKVVVGVHYREHDAVHDWAVVPPLLGSNAERIFGEGASIEHFIATMRSVENSHVTTDLDRTTRTKVRFFVASNSEKAKLAFRRAFPTAVYLQGAHNRSSTTGVQLALMEWLSLAKSAFILHTYGSTFAEHAAHMHLTPIVGIWEGMLIYHSNSMLPFCGMLIFATVYGKDASVRRKAIIAEVKLKSSFV